MLGSLEVLSCGDRLLIEHLRAVVGGLSELDLGTRRATSIVVIRECLEIIGLGLIDICRFKIGQLLPFSNLAALARIKTHKPPFVNGSDDCDAVLRDEDLSRGEYRPGDGLRYDCFGLYCMALC